ncbi:Na+-transporting oxaloacetate decarboxylase, gamma subunit [Hydrogenimonas sp.]|nr:Na+-transporting oxaloacetate decarboxylase, gamma subunit [Hydrogenimonas sp.]
MENMVAESFKYMILGMGIVFVFLYIMVLVLQFQARLIAKYFPEKPADTGGQAAGVDKKKVAAAIAAIQHHKNLRK